ncbi:MAG: integrin, partial [Deltaproteobacteria bacterium]
MFTTQQAYIKASNTNAGDVFGWSVALSADGNTLAVGAYLEDSDATGIGGEQANNDANKAGAVYIFTRTGTTWSQQTYIKASNTDANDWFGYSVALSADGNTLAVGAHLEDSDATGIDGDEANNSADGAGAVYVFTRTGTSWSHQAYIKASNTDVGDNFGFSVALSSEGNTLAVGAYFEDSNGNEANNSKSQAGAVYVFSRTGTTWSQQAYIKAANTDAYDSFGYSVALSADGNTLAVGAYQEDSSATGINGDKNDNGANSAGAVYIFTRTGTNWNQQAYIKASNTDADDYFGESVTLSADGNTLAVGATGEDSNATGINGDKDNNSTNDAGAVYVFNRTGIFWSQQAYIKASNTDKFDM